MEKIMKTMKIYGLCGEKQSGKNQFAKFAKEIIVEEKKYLLDVEQTIHEVALADPLKTFCMDYIGMSHEACYGSDDDKNRPFSTWGQLFNNNILKLFNKTAEDAVSGREVLQIVGTEIFRQTFRDSFWSDLMINKTIPRYRNSVCQVLFITDVRFFNEIEALKTVGAKIIRIHRHIERKQQIQHVSEQQMAQMNDDMFDYVIYNDGNLQEFNDEVFIFLHEEGFVS
jgi:hypothetical protein